MFEFLLGCFVTGMILLLIVALFVFVAKKACRNFPLGVTAAIILLLFPSAVIALLLEADTFSDISEDVQFQAVLAAGLLLPAVGLVVMLLVRQADRGRR